MNSVVESLSLNPAVVSVITDGSSHDAGRAIGTANLATLQAAAQCCDEAATEARDQGLPCKRHQNRALLCRRRIQLIAAEQKSAS